ncbi:MAG: GNAT family N-acetyltransferase [Vicinamibacterales bacterium]
MPRTEPWSLAAPGDLAPAFAADAERWRRDLRWDTRDLWDAVERARTSGRLDGLVHRDDTGRVDGWTYFVARGGDVHCGALESTSPDATEALVDALLTTPAGAAAERVLLFVYSSAPALEAALRRHAFDVVPYDYRVRALGERTRGAAPGRAWDLRDLDTTAAVLQAAYARTDPRRPFAPHGTTAEWRQYASDLVMGQGCGRFRPSLSLAVPAERGGLDGVALVTDLGEGTAHLAQIAVRPSGRGGGLGAAMLEAVSRQAVAAGFQRLSLLVARDNARATAMYARAGLAVQASFLCAVRPGRRLDGWNHPTAAATASR